jgi:hypothetical protein
MLGLRDRGHYYRAFLASVALPHQGTVTWQPLLFRDCSTALPFGLAGRRSRQPCSSRGLSINLPTSPGETLASVTCPQNAVAITKKGDIESASCSNSAGGQGSASTASAYAAGFVLADRPLSIYPHRVRTDLASAIPPPLLDSRMWFRIVVHGQA